MIDIDTRSLPLVRVTMHGPISDACLDAYHEDVVRLMHRAQSEHRQYGFVIDGRNTNAPSSERRRKIAAFTAAQTPLIQSGCAVMAIVLENALQRGVLKALVWLKPYPMPHRAFKTTEEAESWVRSVLPRDQRASP